MTPIRHGGGGERARPTCHPPRMHRATRPRQRPGGGRRRAPRTGCRCDADEESRARGAACGPDGEEWPTRRGGFLCVGVVNTAAARSAERSPGTDGHGLTALTSGGAVAEETSDSHHLN